MKKNLSAIMATLALSVGVGVSAQSPLPALEKIFSDKACTILTPEYSGMSLEAIRADETYRSLPAVLQGMVDKVKSGNWAETSTNIDGSSVTWDSEHALKYRVQLIEPYSESSNAATMMLTKKHTNLNNPTGLITDDKTTLYIFVEGELEPGASLWFNEQSEPLNHFNMSRYNDLSTIRNTTGYELKEGMNIITTASDNALSYFFYTVETADPKSGARVNRLSSYPDLKIHVEGGRINGFFNIVGDDLYTADTESDYDYLLERAAHADFPLIGRSFINIFPLKGRFPSTGGKNYPGLKELNSSPTFDPMAIMDRWEDVISVVQTTAGFKGREGITAGKWSDYYQYLEDDPESYADYFNNRILNIIVSVDGITNVAMWSDQWYNGIFPQSSEDAMSSLSDLWGISHEYGHTVQMPIKVVGSTEISNNLYANVVGYLMTNLTSRNDFISTLLTRFNNGRSSFDAQNWTGTRMFFQLWLYYHQQGHNKQFYLRLNDILRRDPLTSSSATDYLKFAKAACEASGEDLTDFFEAYGMFLPLKNFSADGTTVNLTAAEIARCKAEIKAMKLPVNRQIIFIDDRPGSTRESRQGYPKENAGEYGGLADFAAGSKSDGKYSYEAKGKEMSISGGSGGVGFIVLGKDGKLLSFANTRTFTMSDEAARALAMGTATVSSVDADGTLTAIPSTGDETSSLLETLQALIAEAKAMSAFTTAEDNIFGNYYTADIAPILTLVDEAEGVLAGTTTDAESLRKAYSALSDKVIEVKSNALSLITPVDGSEVQIINVRSRNFALTGSDSGLSTSTPDAASAAQRWTLVSATAATGKDNSFYLRASNGKYIQGTTMLSEPISLGDYPVAYDYIRLDNGHTVFTESAGRKYSMNINPRGGVVSWNQTTTDEGSQYIMYDLNGSAADSPQRHLAGEIASMQADLDRAGAVEIVSTPIALTDKSFDTNAKCHRGGDAFTTWNVLIDNDYTTYFHSNWESGTTDDGLPHWISIDLGNEEEEIVLNYHTRYQGNVCAPSEILIQSSSDGKTWRDETTLNDNLPRTNNTDYQSPGIILSTPSRHIRMMVKANSTNQQTAGFYYFVISELGAGRPDYKISVAEGYPGVTEGVIMEAYRALRSASGATDDKSAEEELSRLRAAHATLLAAMSETNGIDNVTVEPASATREGIYDLQGRRLNSATAPGVYIINGRKTLVR